MSALPRQQSALPAPDYSPLVVEHFQRPRNAGRLPQGDCVVGTAGSIPLGTMFTLSARIAGGRVAALRFAAYGCPHCIAAGSWLTESLLGASLDDLRAWSWRDAAEMLQVPAEKYGRLLVLEDALRALARAWPGESKQGT